MSRLRLAEWDDTIGPRWMGEDRSSELGKAVMPMKIVTGSAPGAFRGGPSMSIPWTDTLLRKIEKELAKIR